MSLIAFGFVLGLVAGAVAQTPGQMPIPTALPPSGVAAGVLSGTFPSPGFATIAANSLLANSTAGAAAPIATAVPSCSTTASALNWTTSSGLGCNSAVNAASLGGATFAAPGMIGGGTPAAATFTTLVSTTTKTTAVAVGSLPTCNAGAEGLRSGVTDALLPAALAIVAAGGGVHVMVYCNGTNWIVG